MHWRMNASRQEPPDRGKEFAEHGAVTDKLNKRPRKCLGYKTPFEVYYSKTLHLI